MISTETVIRGRISSGSSMMGDSFHLEALCTLVVGLGETSKEGDLGRDLWGKPFLRHWSRG